MKMIIRHVVIAVLFSLFIAFTLISITFVAFPLNHWSMIINKNIGDIPYIVIVVIIPLMLGIIFGLSYGISVRQRFQRIHHQLDDIVKGQELIRNDYSPYNELDDIQISLEKIERKIKLQTEQAQRLATERANEREKGLQAVVIQERNRLARELHDSVSQQLFAASMLMSAINESEHSKSPAINKQLELVEKAIHQSQLEMRALLLHLRPVALKGKDLQKGVEELLIELTQKVPMDITWKIEKFDVDKGVEDQLFRILQESVSNTLRHAEASSLHVMLIKRDHLVILRVIDDGIGFNIQEIKTSSYGLQNMQERAFEVGGDLKVISLPKEGTRIEVKVPIIKKEGEKND
ncbi:MAG TPA: sensor histidine kinase [Candidatus Dormibacteraeota bacterium]|nr:sensor histidine kinase [Candidatus Dormibacteraeota bacterium]